MKYTKQSPTLFENTEEYEMTFKNLNSIPAASKYKFKRDYRRQNAFVPLCRNEAKTKMTFLNCNLFKRSFTNKGIGFTYNIAKATDLIKKSSKLDEAIKIFSVNEHDDIRLMQSSSSEHALQEVWAIGLISVLLILPQMRGLLNSPINNNCNFWNLLYCQQSLLKVLIDYNEEAVQAYENSISDKNTLGDLKKRPTEVLVALHNPDEPANLRSNSFEIPLGHTTTVFITPRAREIDDSGKELDEKQRNCRLSDENGDLEVFKRYTQKACVFECKIKMAAKNCGCIPWSYPMIPKESVSNKIKSLKMVTDWKLALTLFETGGTSINHFGSPTFRDFSLFIMNFQKSKKKFGFS